MKLAALAIASILFAGSLGAQTTAAPAPPVQHEHSMNGMPEQHMQQMKAQVEQMRATLTDMKSNAAQIKDSAGKRQAQLDAQMWEKMVTHMEGMVNMMSSRGPAGHSMSCCSGMKAEGKEAGHDCCSAMKDGKGAMSCCGEGGGSCGKPQKAGGDSLPDHDMPQSPPQ
jgi:hypothetical protein